MDDELEDNVNEHAALTGSDVSRDSHRSKEPAAAADNSAHGLVYEAPVTSPINDGTQE